MSLKLFGKLLCLVLARVAAREIANPRMPDRFTVQFNELMYIYNATAPQGIAHLNGNSSGSWTYDVATTRWVYEHGADGFFSEFCAANDPAQQRCWIHFHANDAMKVLYENGTCCSLCSPAEGCGFLRPDWLTFGGYKPIVQPSVTIDGAKCVGWGRPGAVTSVDAWFETEDGTPCMYFERFVIPSMGVVHHNVTFRRQTYSTDVSDDVWKIPDSCSTTCPKHGYPPKQSARPSAVDVGATEPFVV